MKSKSYLLLIIGILALSMLVGWTAFGQKQSSSRTVWEYKVVYRNSSLPLPTNVLDELGAEGWELVAVRDGHSININDGYGNSNNQEVHYFKRAK